MGEAGFKVEVHHLLFRKCCTSTNCSPHFAFVFTPAVPHPATKPSSRTVTLSPDTLSGGSIPRKLLTPLLWLAILLSAAVFTIRGPLRASADYANDFAAPYTSARLWLQHQNPYNPEVFWPTFHAAGAPTTPLYANPSSTHSIYPPPSVVVLSPFALLPWPTAWRTLILLSTALYLTALILLSRLIPPPAHRKPWTSPCQLVFIALGLLLAPAQSALHVSNVTILSANLLFIALYLLLRPQNRVSHLLSLVLELGWPILSSLIGKGGCLPIPTTTTPD